MDITPVNIIVQHSKNISTQVSVETNSQSTMTDQIEHTHSVTQTTPIITGLHIENISSSDKLSATLHRISKFHYSQALF